MFLGLIVLNPTPLFHGKPAEWGCFYGFGYRSYNFSLGLGFSGRSGSGSSLLPDLGTPPMTSLPPSAPIASLMLMLLGIPLSLGGVRCLSVRKSGIRWT